MLYLEWESLRETRGPLLRQRKQKPRPSRRGGFTPSPYVATRGFKDAPFIGRGNRRRRYDLAWVKPKPFVQRRHAFVDEPMEPSGKTLQRLGKTQGGRSRETSGRAARSTR